MTKKLEFLCSIPPLQSAITIDGSGNGARIKIDIPETELYNASEIFNWRMKVIKITAELLEDNDNSTAGRRTAKQRI